MGDAKEIEPSLPGYWQATARPFTSLIFVLPMLAIYEVGILLLGSHAIRNGVDVWLRQFLEVLGFGQYFLLPLLTISVLLGWHHLMRYPWRSESRYLPMMLAESTALGFLILGLAMVQAHLMKLEVASAPATSNTTLTLVIAYFGAGIYEELLFRLMLIPVLVMLFRSFQMPSSAATLGAVLLSSLVFASAHYQFLVVGGEAFDLYSFMFRVSAGFVFGTIFALRGFGIAAGSHAMYDVFVALA